MDLAIPVGLMPSLALTLTSGQKLHRQADVSAVRLGRCQIVGQKRPSMIASPSLPGTKVRGKDFSKVPYPSLVSAKFGAHKKQRCMAINPSITSTTDSLLSDNTGIAVAATSQAALSDVTTLAVLEPATLPAQTALLKPLIADKS